MATNMMTRKQRVWLWNAGYGFVYLSLLKPEWHEGYWAWEPQSVDAGTGPHIEIPSGWLFPLFGIRVTSLKGNAVQFELPVLMERLPRFTEMLTEGERRLVAVHY